MPIPQIPTAGQLVHIQTKKLQATENLRNPEFFILGLFKKHNYLALILRVGAHPNHLLRSNRCTRYRAHIIDEFRCVVPKLAGVGTCAHPPNPYCDEGAVGVRVSRTYNRRVLVLQYRNSQGWALVPIPVLFRLFSNVSQNTTVYIEDVAVYSVGSVRSQEYCRTCKFFWIQPATSRSASADELIKWMA